VKVGRNIKVAAVPGCHVQLGGDAYQVLLCVKHVQGQDGGGGCLYCAGASEVDGSALRSAKHIVLSCLVGDGLEASGLARLTNGAEAGVCSAVRHFLLLKKGRGQRYRSGPAEDCGETFCGYKFVGTNFCSGRRIF
jgi:hypothetical protein